MEFGRWDLCNTSIYKSNKKHWRLLLFTDIITHVSWLLLFVWGWDEQMALPPWKDWKLGKGMGWTQEGETVGQR